MTLMGAPTFPQSAKQFPAADLILKDAKHKEQKGGVQLGPGNPVTIQSGREQLPNVLCKGGVYAAGRILAERWFGT